MITKFSLKPCKFHKAHVTIAYSAGGMIGVRQRIGHMTVVGHYTCTCMFFTLVVLNFVGATAYKSQYWYYAMSVLE